MKTVNTVTALAIAAIIGLAAGPPARPAVLSQQTAKPDSHRLAPAFSLVDLQGRTVRLADYRGKLLLLDFWATWCVPCRTEIPRFVEWQKQYGEQGFQVVGIAMDDRAQPVREFYRRFKMNYPVAMGDEKVAKAYGGILGLPVNLLIGRDGRIHARHTGESDLRSLRHEIEYLLRSEQHSTTRGAEREHLTDLSARCPKLTRVPSGAFRRDQH